MSRPKLMRERASYFFRGNIYPVSFAAVKLMQMASERSRVSFLMRSQDNKATRDPVAHDRGAPITREQRDSETTSLCAAMLFARLRSRPREAAAIRDRRQ